jgi:hypothetical protein
VVKWFLPEPIESVGHKSGVSVIRRRCFLVFAKNGKRFFSRNAVPAACWIALRESVVSQGNGVSDGEVHFTISVHSL